jgi:hypothetical protein
MDIPGSSAFLFSPRECGVGTLVLSHIVPGNTPVGHLIKAKRNFSGELIIGEDLMQIGMGKARSGKSGIS